MINKIKKLFIDNQENRINWVSLKLKEINNGETILDAGAGKMRYKKYCNHLKYTSQDFNKYNGKGNGKGLQVGSWERKTDITSDIVNIPVKNDSFDNILCTEVLEHIPHPEEAIKEFSRILKKGGKLILTAPFCSLTHFAPYHFSTGFSEYWYSKILEENNFEIKKLEKNGNYFNYLEQENIRLGSMSKKYCNQNIIIVTLIKITSLIQIIILKYLSKKDNGSNEILYFGTHLVAIKK